MEIDLIARYKSNQKEFGYNIENGGNSIGKISESTKEKLRNANLGKKASEETKRKISESNKGKHRNITKETRNKMVLSRKKNGNYEPWNKGKTLLGVPVIKLDLQGNEIKKYTSIHSAQLDTGSTHVRECCEGKRKIDKGFMWKYAE